MNQDSEDFRDLPRYLEETTAFDDADDVIELSDSDDPFFELSETVAEAAPEPIATEPEPQPLPSVAAPVQTSSRAALMGIGGGAALAIGGVMLMAASLTAPEFAAGFLKLLDSLQLGPAQLVICGLILLGFGGIRRRQLQSQQVMQTLIQLAERATQASDDGLDQIYDFGERQGSAQASIQEDLQCSLHALQRQDEKIANLTRATKMYGKPLMEITNQLADTNTQVTEVASELREIKVALQENRSYMEDLVRANPGGGQDSEALSRVLRRMGEDLRQELERGAATRGRNDDLQPTLEEMRVAMGALRHEFEEMRETRAAVDLQPLAKETREAIDALRKELSSHESAGFDPSHIEAPMRAVRDQIKGLEQMIQGLSRGGAAPAPAPAPESRSTHKVKETSQPQPSEPAIDERQPSTSGRKKGDGKNVLGAIEKLKRLRG